MPGSRIPVVYPRDLAPPGPPALAGLQRVGVALGARRDRAVVRTGDVLVTARGTRLRAAVVPLATVGAVASANLLLVRLRAGLLPEVLAAYLESPAGRDQLLARGQGATGFVITPRALGSLEIPVPSPGIQQRLARFVRAARESISATEQLLELRKELLQTAIAQVFETGSLPLGNALP